MEDIGAALGPFEKLRKATVSFVMRTRITGTLHEDQCAFSIISLSILLRMRNISEKKV